MNLAHDAVVVVGVFQEQHGRGVAGAGGDI